MDVVLIIDRHLPLHLALITTVIRHIQEKAPKQERPERVFSFFCDPPVSEIQNSKPVRIVVRVYDRYHVPVQQFHAHPAADEQTHHDKRHLKDITEDDHPDASQNVVQDGDDSDDQNRNDFLLSGSCEQGRGEKRGEWEGGCKYFGPRVDDNAGREAPHDEEQTAYK